MLSELSITCLQIVIVALELLVDLAVLAELDGHFFHVGKFLAQVVYMGVSHGFGKTCFSGYVESLILVQRLRRRINQTQINISVSSHSLDLQGHQVLFHHVPLCFQYSNVFLQRVDSVLRLSLNTSLIGRAKAFSSACVFVLTGVKRLTGCGLRGFCSGSLLRLKCEDCAK